MRKIIYTFSEKIIIDEFKDFFLKEGFNVVKINDKYCHFQKGVFIITDQINVEIEIISINQILLTAYVLSVGILRLSIEPHSYIAGMTRKKGFETIKRFEKEYNLKIQEIKLII